MTKKLLALIACSALAVLCLAGCGAKSEEAPAADTAAEPIAAGQVEASIVIGDVEAFPQFVVLANGTGKDITAVMVKPSSDQAYDGPLGQEGAWADGEVAEVHYNAIEAEPRYDLRFEFADGTDVVAEGIPMFDVVNGTVTMDGLNLV